MEVSAEISLSYFEQFFVTPFVCECLAKNSHGETKSGVATITQACEYFKNKKCFFSVEREML